MPDNDDPHYTYNTLSNEDKDLLLRNGYRPGELTPEDERELVADLRSQTDDDDDDVPADEQDGTE